MREVVWMGRTREEVRSFPKEVRRSVGAALMAAQQGDLFPTARPLRGFHGAGVVEIISDHDGDTYRTIYTVRLRSAIYVLHAFQKKSTHGIATPKREIEQVRRALVAAEGLDATRTKGRQG